MKRSGMTLRPMADVEKAQEQAGIDEYELVENEGGHLM